MGYAYFYKNTERYCPICEKTTKHRRADDCGALDYWVFDYCLECETGDILERRDKATEYETVRKHEMPYPKAGKDAVVVNYTCKECGKEIKSAVDPNCRNCGAYINLEEIHLSISTKQVAEILGETIDDVRQRGSRGDFEAYRVPMGSYYFDSGLVFAYLKEKNNAVDQ